MADFLSREELLGGLPARQAGTLLFAIEAQTARMVDRSQRMLEVSVSGAAEERRERAFMAALAQARDLPFEPTIQQIDRHWQHWAHLVPGGSDIRAGLANAMARKYPLSYAHIHGIRSALGLESEEVREAYERHYGEPLEAALDRRIGLVEQLRWYAARLSRLPERLSPFWLTFGLTVGFGIPQALLALPIAVTAVGPGAGLLAVLVLGFLSTLTMLYMAEASARFSGLRYGNAFAGQMVDDFLGRLGSVALSTLLALRTSIVLLAVFVGLGLTLATLLDLPAGVWAALAFLLAVHVILGRSFHATVNALLVLAIVNVGLIVSVTVFTLGEGRWQNVFTAAVEGVVRSEAHGAGLQAFFGVAIMLYFGHVFVVQCAKITIPRDPGGGELMRGALAGSLCLIAVIAIWTIAVNGSLSAQSLTREAGTVLVPLANEIGAPVGVLGLLLTLSLLGIAGLRSAQLLYNLVLERLPDRAAGREDRRGDGRAARALSSLAPQERRARRFPRAVSRVRANYVAAALPVGAVFLLAEWLLWRDAASFSGLIGVAGITANALVAGVFPVLLLVSSRRKGDSSPATACRFPASTALMFVVYAVFLAVPLAHGLFVWESPLARAWALALAVGALVLTVLLGRAGAFSPRVVFEWRENERSGSAPAYAITSDGRPAGLPVEFRGEGGSERRTDARGEAPLRSSLGQVLIDIPQEAPRELKIWCHRVTPDGDTRGLPVAVDVRAEAGSVYVRGDAEKGRWLARLPRGRCVATLTFASPEDAHSTPRVKRAVPSNRAGTPSGPGTAPSSDAPGTG